MRGGRSGIAVAQNAQGHMFYQKLCSRIANGPISGHLNYPLLPNNRNSDVKISKHVANSHLGTAYPLSVQCNEKFPGIYPRKRSVKRECNFSSRHSLGGSFLQRAEDRIGVGYWQSLQSEHVRVNRTRAFYKSEEYDITEPKVDSLKSTEIPSEAVLVEGDVQGTTPWWQKFPKRWVIVLLCFASFLLCNMDRVSIFSPFFLCLLVSLDFTKFFKVV